jgi:hypothetical protein
MFLVTSDTSIEAALRPMKLGKRIRETSRERSRFAIQSLGLD